MSPEVPVVLSVCLRSRSRIDFLALRSYGDGALFAEVFGEGPPRVLALHGWGRRGRDFAASLEGISAIAPDLPGFGASPPPAEVMGAHGYANLVARLLAEFEHPPAVVGHSFGGRIAVCLAASRPDEVGRLLLTGVPLLRTHPGSKPSVSYRLIRALNRRGLISDERLEAEKRRRGSADYRTASGIMRDILVKVINEEYRDELGNLASPVLLLWGADDREVPPSIAETALEIMQRCGADGRLEIVAGVGHHLPLERPELVRQAVAEMVR